MVYFCRPEINIKPWEALLNDLKEGNKKIPWKRREAYAYWKGNRRSPKPEKIYSNAMSLTNKTGMLVYSLRYWFTFEYCRI